MRRYVYDSIPVELFLIIFLLSVKVIIDLFAKQYDEKEVTWSVNKLDRPFLFD